MKQRTRFVGTLGGYRWRVKWPPKLGDLAKSLAFYAALAGAGWLIFA